MKSTQIKPTIFSILAMLLTICYSNAMEEHPIVVNIGGIDLKNTDTIAYLYYKKLPALSSEIKYLSNLKYVYLDSNLMTTLPPEIKYLSNLKTLWISWNQLTHLPKEIGKLSSLKSLCLRGNNLSILPPEICNLVALKHLDLAHNPWKFKWGQILNNKAELDVFRAYYRTKGEVIKNCLILILANQIDKNSTLSVLPKDAINYLCLVHFREHLRYRENHNL